MFVADHCHVTCLQYIPYARKKTTACHEDQKNADRHFQLLNHAHAHPLSFLNPPSDLTLALRPQRLRIHHAPRNPVVLYSQAINKYSLNEYVFWSDPGTREKTYSLRFGEKIDCIFTFIPVCFLSARIPKVLPRLLLLLMLQRGI
ncbi:MAG: hypothetical protein IKD72_02755 [Clostridia bacterium]|nr:hypothetical protein [Clostridia bacterium]